MDCKPATRHVAYYRVSTKRQEASGLGLEAQQEAVNAHCRAYGCEVIAEFKEAESGKRADRPALQAALNHCRLTGATLIIAKLDRLARNVAFLANLMESGVDFIACDNPHATRLTVHILAAVAEDEAKRISDRTKAALAAYKARGGKLGASLPQCRNLTDDARAKGAESGTRAASDKAAEFRARVAPMIQAWRNEGLTLQAIADRLNGQHIPTARGKAWSHVQVRDILARLA